MFTWLNKENYTKLFIFPLYSSPGRSPGRAIILPPGLALASALVASSALAKC